MSEYAWEGLPLCNHGYQFDCQECLYENMSEEERRKIRTALFDYMTLLQREDEFQEEKWIFEEWGSQELNEE